MKPLLYSYWRSSCSYRARIALNLKGIDYDYRAVHLVKDGGEQLKDEYLSLNPKGEVPFFVHGEHKISQTMVIMDYLDRHFDGAKLIPENKNDRLTCLQICELINSGIQPLQNLKVIKHVVKTFSASDDQKTEWIVHWINEGFVSLEKLLEGVSGKFAIGDTISVADCFIVPQVYNAVRYNIDMNKFPNIKRVNGNCLALEAVDKARPEVQPDAQ